MDKTYLVEAFERMATQAYVWNLYFYKIDRRNNNPYRVYKIRFKNNQYLQEYAKALAKMMLENQLNKTDEIKDYTGENTKVSCDKIHTENELIKEQWEYLVSDVAVSSEEKVSGKYHGYILEGKDMEQDKSLVLVKMANPIINFKNKRSVVFSFSENKELAEFSDEVCKLYMDVDFIVKDNLVFSFNYKFEDFFNIEKTMQKVKQKALEQISQIDAFSSKDEFENYAKAYKSPRTFLTLKAERVDRIKIKLKRKELAKMLKIELDSNDKFKFRNDEEVSLLIRYLCFKVFKDGETQDLLEANNVSKIAF